MKFQQRVAVVSRITNGRVRRITYKCSAYKEVVKKQCRGTKKKTEKLYRKTGRKMEKLQQDFIEVAAWYPKIQIYKVSQLVSETPCKELVVASR